VSTTQPIDAIANATAGIGQLHLLDEVDAAVRSKPPVMDYERKAIASVALLAASTSVDFSISHIQPHPGESMHVGKPRPRESGNSSRGVAVRAAAATVEPAPVMAAGNALPPAVTAAASPGYDASQKVEPATATPFDNTTVMNKTGAPERPRAGGGKTGQEP
jgi:hypothetical protein